MSENTTAIDLETLKKYDPEIKDVEIDKFLDSIKPKEREDAKTVLLHFFLNFKRRLLGLDVIREVVPIIQAEPGTGKTHLIRKLNEEIGSFCVTAEVASLEDARNYIHWGEAHIVCVDALEMEKPKSLEKFKEWIASDKKLECRPMYSNDKKKLSKPLTIGFTNMSLKEFLGDENKTTSRHYVIESKQKEGENFQGLDAVSFVKILQAINHEDRDQFIVPPEES